MDSKTPVDIVAAAVAFGGVLEIVPAIASLLTIVWMSIRIYQLIKDAINKNKGA